MTSRTPLAPARSGAPARARLVFIRHGETDWNREGRLQGSKDIALNDLGRQQAATVGQPLRDLLGPKVETLPWIVSPMIRARETADILRHRIGMPKGGYRIDPRLEEINFGSWEGLTWRDVAKLFPDRARARTRNKWGYVPPDGESYAMLLDRVWPVFDDLDGETIVVAHGGIARTLLLRLAGLDEHEATVVDIWQGRVLVFEAGGAYWVP